MNVAVAVVAVPVVAAGLVFSLLIFGDTEPARAEAPSGGTGGLNTAAIPAPYRAAVTAAGKRCKGVTGPLLAAQLEAESGWNPTAASGAGAAGLAQFMPGTWASWGKDYDGDGAANVLDPLDAIGSQADFMCALRTGVDAQLASGEITGDPIQLTLAAYNAGPGAVSQHGGIPPFSETTKYVARILGNIAKYTAAAASPTGSVSAGGGPAVTKDGTARASMAGSGHLDLSNLCKIPWSSAVLRCDATQALEKLNTAYKAQFGVDLGISGGYRDYASQVLVKAQKGGLAATPGTSNHGWGLAVDLSGIGAEGSTRHAWLRANAPAFGWQHPSWARNGGAKPEAWHWEFVGTPK